MVIGYAVRVRGGIDADAPSQADVLGVGAPHAVASGGPVALCGAPVDRTSGEPWPPASGGGCPLCTEVLKGYQR